MAAEDARKSGRTALTTSLGLREALALLAFQAIVMVVVGRLLWDWSGRPVADFLTFSAGEVGQGVALGLALIALALALFRGFPQVSESLVRMQAKTYAFLGPKLGLPAIVFISLCAGIGEEALFRGGLQTLVGDHLGHAAAIALSSALFAAIHLGKPTITVILWVVGAVFGLVYWLTGSLLTVMIGHALYDIWALRYLHREFVRLELVGEESAPLANPAAGG